MVRSPPMRILSNDYHSNLPNSPHPSYGGTVNFARNFSTYVSEQGHEWIGLIHRLNKDEKTTVKKEKGYLGRTYYSCSFSNTHYRSFLELEKRCDPRVWFAPQIKSVRQYIRRLQPDLLFLNGFPLFAWILLEAAAQEQVPIVIQHAGILRIEFEQYKHLYTNVGRAMLLDMEREIVALATKQIFLNEYSRDVYNKMIAPVPKKQALIIPLPYQEAFAEQAAQQQPKSVKKTDQTSVTIGCVARWDRIKNLRAFLRVAQEAKRQKLPWIFRSVINIPDTPVDARMKQSFKKMIDVLAPMSQAALVPFYQSLDLLILPSYFDVSPTVVMEGALLHKPTLISPTVGWTSEYRTCGLDDWIIDFTDEKKVVQQIRVLLKQPVSPRFRRFILSKHAPNRVFSKYLQVFTSVI